MSSNPQSSETFSEHISGAARGCDWGALDWDVLVYLLTDGEYSAAVEEATRPGNGGTVRELERHRPLVQEVLDGMAEKQFFGRKTLAWAMHLIAKRLQQDGIEVPRCWFPITKRLWPDGPATMDFDMARVLKFRRGRLLF